MGARFLQEISEKEFLLPMLFFKTGFFDRLAIVLEFVRAQKASRCKPFMQ
jgi:hypothetical protein